MCMTSSSTDGVCVCVCVHNEEEKADYGRL